MMAATLQTVNYSRDGMLKREDKLMKREVSKKGTTEKQKVGNVKAVEAHPRADRGYRLIQATP
jgi:hypothetical protein